MPNTNEKKGVLLCPMCNAHFSGCPCNRRKADDSKTVHAKCLSKYNYKLKKEKDDQEKKENQ